MVAADDSRQNVTGQTTFSIRFSAAKSGRRIRPDGSCTRATCTATKYGRHTVTGTLDLGNSTISGTAALQVVPRHRQRGRPWPIVELRLEPATATIGLGKGGQQYHAIATARDGSEHDVTAGTTFTFQQDDGSPSGDCPDAICRPPEVGSYTITGTFRQQGHRTLTAAATLLVVYTNLSLEPSNATIWLGDGQQYHAFADDRYDVTDETTFTFKKMGSSLSGPCPDAICTPPETGRYLITGTFPQPDGRTLTAQATLLVVHKTLSLKPPNAMIGLGEGKKYQALADGIYDVTDRTTFTFKREDGSLSGSCPNATCTPPKTGSYTITGSFAQPDGRTLTAQATLLVIYTNLSLEPGTATIGLGEGKTYQASANGDQITAGTTFTFKQDDGSPSGDCPDATCRPPEVGSYTITGTFRQQGHRTLTAEATLLVIYTELTLTPSTATIGPHQSQQYHALANGVDVTARTAVSFKEVEDGSPAGFCPDASCTPPKTGRYTITGSFAQPDGPTLTAQATLLVIYTNLSLEPGTATIGLGEGKTYQASANGDQVTAGTTFTFQREDGSPSGDCPDATCRPPETGRYTITGSFAQPNGPTLTAQATLLVRQEELASLELHPTPASGMIESGGKVTYSVHGLDANGKHLEPPDDLAPFTHFEIDPPGSCTGATCTATPPGQYKVTARLIDDPKINGFATLLVVRGDLASLELHPDTAVIQSGGKVTYSAHGLDANGKHLERPDDLAPFIHFDIDPKSGSCTGHICTATAIGQYTVTGTLPQPDGRTLTAKATLLVVPGDITNLELHPKPNPAVIKPGGEVTYSVHGLGKSGNHLDQLGDLAPFTSFEIDRDGSCTGATCTATKLGQHAVTATLDLGDRDVTGKATLRVATAAPNCTPSASDVRTLEVTPGKGASRTQLGITGKVNPTLANCLLRIFFGGSNLGDVTVGSDGSVSEHHTVPKDAKPGIIPVGLATTGGQVLAERPFEVTAEPIPWSPWERGLPWLLFILLLLLLVPALLGERNRRQRRWVQKHFRAEPHPSAEDVTSLDQDPESEPSFSWRLQAHGDAGTQTFKEGD